jgi:WD40 repeat protein
MAPVLGHEDFVSAYETSSDGTMLASIALKTIDDQAFPAVLLWDPAQGTELQTLTLSEPGLCLDFSPNGSLLAVGVGSALEIWDLSTATKIVSLQGMRIPSLNCSFHLMAATSPPPAWITSFTFGRWLNKDFSI